MRILSAATAFLLTATLGASSGQAAEISIISMQYSASHPVPYLHYEGDTEAGDVAALEGLYNTFVNCRESCSDPWGAPTAVLTMNGLGGNYAEGLALADFLREKHIATVVERGAYCYSACAFAFLGGSALSTQEGIGTYIDRMIEPGSTLGFHAPYKDEAAFRAALEASGAMATQGQTRDSLALMVKELVKWNVDPEVIFKMVGMGPNETYNIKTADDLYLARVNLPPTPATGWITNRQEAIRNICTRLLAIDERADPAEMTNRFLSGYTEGIGKAEYDGTISGYKLGDRLLDIGSCSSPDSTPLPNGDFEASLYFTPGIMGFNSPSTSFRSRERGWSTAGQGGNPVKRIFAKGPLSSYFLPLDVDIDNLDLPGEADIEANKFQMALPPLLPLMPADLVLDASGSATRISHAGNVFVFERVGPRTLYQSAFDKPTLGRTLTNDVSNDVSFIRSGTFDDTGVTFTWFGMLDGENALVIEAIIVPPDTVTPTDAEMEMLRRVQCETDFNGVKLNCG